MNARTAAPSVQPLAHTIPEAAALLGVGRTTVYELIRSGELPSIRIRRGRRVTRAAIEAYLADRTAA